MLDLKWIIENPDAFNKAMEKRGVKLTAAKITKLDTAKRELTTSIQSLQQQRNSISKEIGKSKASGGDPSDLMKKSTEINKELDKLQNKVEDKDNDELYQILIGVPNILQDDVPLGKDDEDNIEIRKWGEPTKFDFKPKAHYELGEELGLMDFEQAGYICGARSTILLNELSLLERALSNYFLDTVTKYGYKEMSIPFLVNDTAMFGTTNLPKFAEDAYKTTDGKWLIPTSEVTLTNWVNNKILDEAELPLRLASYTACFRSEAGSAGRDTRGMLRQHQFKKVEMVSITTPEKSNEEHERMTSIESEILKKLELPFRVMILSSGDTGFASTKTCDHEVWLPGQNNYREISSCSNCNDIQARRMKTRYRNSSTEKTEFVHTLNGSAFPIGRTIIAIMENYQQKDGSIKIPKVLIPYMNGIEIISKK